MTAIVSAYETERHSGYGVGSTTILWWAWRRDCCIPETIAGMAVVSVARYVKITFRHSGEISLDQEKKLAA